LFLTTLLAGSGGALPANFVVTLAKVTVPEQVTGLVTALEALERRLMLRPGAVPLELMVETPQSLFGPRGELALPALVAAACRRPHAGSPRSTRGRGLTGTTQGPGHPACEYARHAMQAALAGPGMTIPDGPTNGMPVPPHRVGAGVASLTASQRAENRDAIHR